MTNNFTAEEDGHYSQGVCEDGAAILRDGERMTVDEVVAELNAYATLLEQREAGVTEKIVAKAGHAYVAAATDPLFASCDLRQMRAALEDVWSIAAEPAPVIGVDLGSPAGECTVKAHRNKDGAVVIDSVEHCLPEPAQPADSGRVTDAIVTGALFDLMGFLTCREEVTTLSAVHDAGAAVSALQAFAGFRDLILDDANVMGWQAALAAQGQGDSYAPLSIPDDAPDSYAEAYIRDWCPDHVKAYIARKTAPPASPAGVPDGWRETILSVLSALDAATGDSDPNIDADLTDDEVRDEYPEVWAMQQLSALLAAPSAPEGDGGAK